MKVYTTLESIEQLPETCAALGYFDGIHAGHQALIGRCVSDARERGVKSCVFTFSNSPKAALRRLKARQAGNGQAEEEPDALMTWDEKVQALTELGVDYLVAPAFDERIRPMDPERFVSELLVGACHMTGAYCGFNYSFGYKAGGKPEDLERMGREGVTGPDGGLRTFTTYIQPPFTVEGNVVSSTLVRNAVREGAIAEANRYLGHLFSLEGDAVPGRRIGTKIGFPTANFRPDPSLLLPPDGVYVTLTELDGVRHPSVTNLGTNPTVNGTERRVETHIIAQENEFPALYGKHIRVFFAQRLRGEIKFAGEAALREQIARDKAEAADYWKNALQRRS